MKKYIVILLVTSLCSYIGYHKYVEYRIEQKIHIGANSQIVTDIFGSPLQLEKVNNIRLSNNEFVKYKSGNQSGSLNRGACKGVVTKTSYYGHSCFFVCPSAFEDTFTVYFDKNDRVCEFKRLSL